jgi:hypothetical protein
MKAIAAIFAAAFVLAGCGGAHRSHEAALSHSGGAQLFRSIGCGSCHTLAAARATGQIGPDLDQLRPRYAAVVAQVEHGGGGMPSFRQKLTLTQIRLVAHFVARTANGSGSAFLIFKPDQTRLAECHDQFLCLRQAFGNIAYRDGPATALGKLASLSRADTTVANLCHPIAHAIGHAAYERYHGDAGRALSEGGMTCNSGYYHGVVERAFAGVPRSKVFTMARTMCTRFETASATFRLYQCVHGLGHGLMIYSANDLPYSLKVCDSLGTPPIRQTCTGGVFMQNFLPGVMAIAPTKWVRKNDLLYPCDVVAAQDKLYCYLIVTSRILPQVGYNWTKASAWCRRAETVWVRTCFQSLGRDASGFTTENPRAIMRICHAAAGMERECIYGAVRDITATDASAKRSPALCRLAPQAMKSYCYAGVGTIIGSLTAGSAARRRECLGAAPDVYRESCIRGSGA